MGKFKGKGKKGYKKGKKNTKKASKAIVYAIKEQAGLTVINKVSKVMKFTRSNINSFTILNTLGTSSQSGVVITRLSDIPNYTEFTALFDKYKINWIKYNFRMVNAPDSTDEMPTMYTYKMNDSDDTGATVTELSVEQQPFVKRMQFSETNRSFTTKVFPYWLSIVYGSSLTPAGVGYADNSAKRSTFIDTRYSNVAHYGLAFYIPSIAGGLTTDWKIVCDLEYNMSFQDMA